MLIILNKRKKKNSDNIKGIIYGKNIKNIEIELKNKKDIYKIKNNSEIKIKFLEKDFKVKIKNIKKHPFKKKIIHVDFFLINE